MLDLERFKGFIMESVSRLSNLLLVIVSSAYERIWKAAFEYAGEWLVGNEGWLFGRP